MHAQRSSPVELALRARREDPKRLLLEPLRGQRVLLGTWLELQIPTRSCPQRLPQGVGARGMLSHRVSYVYLSLICLF